MRHQIREAGSPQEAIAAHYIAKIFSRFDLSPNGDDSTYYQNYTITSGVRLGKKENRIKIGKNKFSTRFSDIIPWPNSASAKVEGVLAWTGYGYTDSSGSYNDYQNINVNGKVVLFVRNHPFSRTETSSDAYLNLARKIRLAQNNGAVAVIVAPGYETHVTPDFFPLGKYDPSLSNFKIPVMQVSNRIASQLLAKA